MNLREQKEAPEPLKPYENRPYGFFTWEGAMTDLAISHDEPVALAWLIDGGAVDKTTKTLCSRTLLTVCVERGKKKCAKLLRDRGFPAE